MLLYSLFLLFPLIPLKNRKEKCVSKNINKSKNLAAAKVEAEANFSNITNP